MGLIGLSVDNQGLAGLSDANLAGLSGASDAKWHLGGLSGANRS